MLIPNCTPQGFLFLTGAALLRCLHRQPSPSRFPTKSVEMYQGITGAKLGRTKYIRANLLRKRVPYATMGPPSVLMINNPGDWEEEGLLIIAPDGHALPE